jgi:hypothetical protein
MQRIVALHEPYSERVENLALMCESPARLFILQLHDVLPDRILWSRHPPPSEASDFAPAAPFCSYHQQSYP